MRTIKVLNPVANIVATQAPISARISSFNGKTAGILWNGKPNWDILLTRVLELLKARFNLASHVWPEARESTPHISRVLEVTGRSRNLLNSFFIHLAV